MIYGYCRVSSRGQIENNSLKDQEQEILKKYPNAIIMQEQFTGAKINRPIFQGLIDKLNKGDILVVTKLDRFCRSTSEGLACIEDLMNRGVSIHILNMGLIEDTPMGKLIVTNLLAFSEFERAMIIERTQTGKAIAQTKDGFKEGRPKKFTDEQLKHAVQLLEKYSYKEVEKMTRISKSTLIREVRKIRKEIL